MDTCTSQITSLRLARVSTLALIGDKDLSSCFEPSCLETGPESIYSRTSVHSGNEDGSSNVM